MQKLGKLVLAGMVSLGIGMIANAGSVNVQTMTAEMTAHAATVEGVTAHMNTVEPDSTEPSGFKTKEHSDNFRVLSDGMTQGELLTQMTDIDIDVKWFEQGGEYGSGVLTNSQVAALNGLSDPNSQEVKDQVDKAFKNFQGYSFDTDALKVWSNIPVNLADITTDDHGNKDYYLTDWAFFRKNNLSMTVNFKTSDGSTLPTTQIPETSRTITGVKGETVDEPLLFPTIDGYTADKHSVTFDGSDNQDETVTYIPNAAVKKVAIMYKLPDGATVPTPDTVNLIGYGAKVASVKSPSISGYTPDQSTVNVDYSKYSAGDQTNTITVTYKKASANSGSGSVSTPSEISAETPVPFKVYGKQALYRYPHADFKKSERLQGYAKKARAYAPVFTVVKTVKSAAGHARYELSDGTYITANSDYTGKLYWQGTYTSLYVTNPKGINGYQTAKFTTKMTHFKQGTELAVTKMVRRGAMTRYELTDGIYVTGNKQFVSATKPQRVTRVKTKTTVKVYQSMDLKKVVKTLKKGAVIAVKGWDYANGNSASKYYRVTDGYVTANNKNVQIIK